MIKKIKIQLFDYLISCNIRKDILTKFIKKDIKIIILKVRKLYTKDINKKIDNIFI